MVVGGQGYSQFLFPKEMSRLFGSFCSSAGEWFHKWGNHGENSDVPRGSLPSRQAWPWPDEVPPRAHGFVFGGTLQWVLKYCFSTCSQSNHNPLGCCEELNAVQIMSEVSCEVTHV